MQGMPASEDLDLRTQYPTAITTTSAWSKAAGAFFESPELGKRIGDAFRGKQLMLVKAIKATMQSKVLQIFQAQEPKLEGFLIDQIEPLLSYTVDENFTFEVIVVTQADVIVPRVRTSVKLSHPDVLGTFPTDFKPKKDIEILPGMISRLMPASALSGMEKDVVHKIATAIVCFLLLAFNAVHWAHEDEGSMVQDIIDRLSRLVVGHYKDADGKGPDMQVAVGTKKVPVLRPLSVVMIMEKVQSKLTQTRQNVREVHTPYHPTPPHSLLSTSYSPAATGCPAALRTS